MPVQEELDLVGGTTPRALVSKHVLSSPHAEKWARFISFCEDMKFGEITALKIQDGVPVLAELATKKVKFA